MKLQIEMPIVAGCAAKECAYNHQLQCSARAVTIGGGSHPACDTYIARHKDWARHSVPESLAAGVGACKVYGCRHNQNLECTVQSIHVNEHAAHADCATYEAAP